MRLTLPRRSLSFAVGPHHTAAMFDRIKARFKKVTTPPAEFHDAELGVLTADSDLWSGTITRHGITIPFTVAGTQAAPDSALLDRVRDIIGRFNEVEAVGLTFLRAEVAEVRSSRFTFNGLTFLWEDQPDLYSLEWLADGDDSCFWIVHFEADKPKDAGFDD